MNALQGSPISLVYPNGLSNTQSQTNTQSQPVINKLNEEEKKKIEEKQSQLNSKLEDQIEKDRIERDNRFTKPIPYKDMPFIIKETEFFTNENCVQHLIKLVKELLLMVKVIMFVLVLLFLIKIMEKKN